MFGWIARAYNWALGKVDSVTAGWVHDLISGIWGFLAKAFGVVGGAWDKLYSSISDFTGEIETLGKETYNWIIWWLRVFWRDWIAWVDKYILGPLRTVVKWVTNEGATIWHYISHPDALVRLIWDDLIRKLENDAWSVADKLGTFFLSLVAKNLKKLLELLADVIDAVF